jgi:hypothetical protein
MMGERSERRDGAWTEEMELTEESEPRAPHPRDAVLEPPPMPSSPAARRAFLPCDAVPEPPSPRRRLPHAPPSPAATAPASPAPAVALLDAHRPSRLASSPRHGGGSLKRSCGGAGRK